MKSHPIIIVTGKSGSGKSTALAAFEDQGYYCVDNMPIALLPAFLDHYGNTETTFAGFVFGMDLREKSFVHQYESVLGGLKTKGFGFRIVFIDANDTILLRRYSQTRRRHPLALNKSIDQAIAEETKTLADIKNSADTVIDTSDLNIHELKAIVRKLAGSASEQTSLNLQIVSFGFKYGPPIHADLIMDVRFLKNPYFDESLRPFSGESEKNPIFCLE